jgi:hypothetical protein
MTTVNAKIEAAQLEFISWYCKDGNEIGNGKGYEQVAAKVKEAVQDLIKENMTLHYRFFRWGFSFFYGEKAGSHKYIPISLGDGDMLEWQSKNESGGIWWPIKDPTNQTYFIPKITLNTIPPPSGSTPTHQYLAQLAQFAEGMAWMRNDERKILEALTPYADEIKEYCDEATYKKIVKLVPSIANPYSFR